MNLEEFYFVSGCVNPFFLTWCVRMGFSQLFKTHQKKKKKKFTARYLLANEITEGKELASGQTSEQFLILRIMVQDWAPMAQNLKAGYSKVILLCCSKETASVTK